MDPMLELWLKSKGTNINFIPQQGFGGDPLSSGFDSLGVNSQLGSQAAVEGAAEATANNTAGFNPYILIGKGLDITGNLLSSSADDDMKQNNPDNIYYQNALSGNTWGDVFNADQEKEEMLDSIRNNAKNFSDVKNVNSLRNAWGENVLQTGPNKSSLSDKAKSVTGEVLSDTGTGLSTGAMIGSIVPGIGTAIGAGIGAGVGAISAGIKSLLNFNNQDEAYEAAQKQVRRANKMTTDSFYDSYKNSVTRMNRDMFMHRHDEGGPLESYNGVEHFNVGGSHNQNPNEGIQQGIASDGKPNLVEEGEKRYKDYIYSDRLKANKSLLKEHKLPEKYAGMTFADICDKLQEESENRPNDPVSIRTLEEWMSRLAAAQEDHKQDIENRRLAKEFNNISDEEKAVLLAASGQGIDLGQPIYASGGKIHIKPENRGKFTALKKRTGKSATWFKQHGTPAQKKMATFALNARKWKHEDGGHLFDAGGRKNPWEVGYLYDNGFLPYDIEATTVSPWDRRYITIQNNNRATGINLPEVSITPEEEQELKENITYPTFDNNQEVINNNYNSTINPENLRYAPVLGSAEAMLKAAAQPKDYTLSNRIENIASQYQPKAAPHIGGYRKYMPYDVNLGDAENLAIEAAALRANSGQNRATQNALNAAVINASQKAAAQRNLAAQQANEANRLAVDQYNLGIDQFNAQRDAQYDKMNAEIENRRLSTLMAAAQAADASNTAWANMYNSTRENFFNQLGNIGQDTWNRNQRDWLLNSLGREGLLELLKSGYKQN